MFGGTITALAFSPAFSSDQTALAGTSEGGVFKTTDGGTHWTEANEGMWFKQMTAVIFSPAFASDQTLFNSAWHGGVSKSTDGGGTWE